MKRKAPSAWPWLSALVAVAVLVAAGMIWFSRRPHFDSFLAPDSTAIQVSILTPISRASFPADSSIRVAATAESALPVAAMELWINGELFEAGPATSLGTSSLFLEWDWRPGSPGEYTLLVRVMDQAGQAAISNLVAIQVSAAAGYLELVTSTAGDSLSSLARQYGLTDEQILAANPVWNPGQESTDSGSGEPPADQFNINLLLQPGALVLIPHPPAQADPGGEPQAEPTAPVQPDAIPAASADFWDKLGFQIGLLLGQQDDLPLAPTLIDSHNYQHCHPLFFISNVDDENGYFVYRLDQDAVLKTRIDTLDALSGGSGSQLYLDSDTVAGFITYIVSSFNAAGENFSAPLTYDLSDCTPAPDGTQYASEETTTGGVGLEDGRLTIPASVDLAYLYVGINGTFWERIPPGNSTFMSESGYQFDLYGYLGEIVDLFPAPDLDVMIEVWGWQGGHVGLIGTYNAEIHRSVLTICSVEGESQCQGRGGSAGWSGEAYLSNELPVDEQFFDLRLELSDALNADDVIFQVSYRKYTSPEVVGVPSGIIYSGERYNPGDPQYYPFPLVRYYNDEPVHVEAWYGTEVDNNVLHELFPPGTPFTLYIRVIPVDSEMNFSLPSNTVVLHYLTPPEPEQAYPLAPNLPSLYTLEILEETYQPPVFINPVTWGCVTVLNNAGGYHEGQVVCPPAYDSGPSSSDPLAVLEGELDLVAGGMSDLAAYFEAAKDAIVDAVASTIPGCGSTCKALLKKGLEVGITALTGLPPSMPNFDELTSQGILYAVDQVQSSLTGYECGSVCEQVLTDKLAAAIHNARQIASQPGCTAVEAVAKYYGRQPGWCLPGNVQVAPYPGGSNQPGGIVVRITRNSTPAPQGNLEGLYFLDVTALGLNTTRTGTFGYECRYYPDGYPVEDPSHYYLIEGVNSFYEDQEEGLLYPAVRFAMPFLPPGGMVEIPIPLQPFGHDNTKDVYIPLVGCDGFAGFKYLFYKGTSQIDALETCYVVENGTYVPCTQGGSDQFEAINPLDPSDQWP